MVSNFEQKNWEMGRESEDEHSTEVLILHFNSSVHTPSPIQHHPTHITSYRALLNNNKYNGDGSNEKSDIESRG